MQMPNDFRKLEESGLLQRLSDPNDSLFVWDADFSSDAVDRFEKLDDQLIEIVPLASTGNGDFWGYVKDRLPESKIYEFYHDSYVAEPAAEGIGGFVFRQAVLFSGCENLDEFDWTVATAKKYVDDTKVAFREFLSTEMSNALDRILEATPVTRGDWKTLILESDAEALVEELAGAGLEELEWRG